MSGLRIRVLVLAGLLALAFTGVLGRLGWLQIVRHADLAALEPSPLQPGDDEVRANPRARSAKLRVLERLP